MYPYIKPYRILEVDLHKTPAQPHWLTRPSISGGPKRGQGT